MECLTAVLSLHRWYYMLSQEEIAREAKAKAHSSRTKQFVSRPIRHPQYKNVSGVQAAELLRCALLCSLSQMHVSLHASRH